MRRGSEHSFAAGIAELKCKRREKRYGETTLLYSTSNDRIL
jgi:hypothetical protein